MDGRNTYDEATKAAVMQEKIAKFRPQRRNLNKHKQRGMGTLETSMRKLGYVAPMTAAADGEIIDGSARLETSAIVFDDGVLVVHHDGTKPIIMVRDDIASADSPEAREISIAANRVAQLNLDWDVEQLLADAQAGLDLQGLFDQGELDAMLAELTPHNAGSDTEPQIDKAEELRQKWGVEPGQLWQLGQHRLICGDCTDKATIERLMGEDRSDICFTSPPYNLGDNVVLSTRNKKDNAYLDYNDSNADYLNLLVSFTDIAMSICRYVLVNVQSLAGNKKDLLRYLHQFIDNFADVAVWTKSNPQPAMANNVMDSAFEFIYFFSSLTNPTRAIDTGDFRGLVSNVLDGKVNSENIIPGSHSATFPIYLPEYFIKHFSAMNRIVYDPFLGSGTTLIAAHNLNRRCFGAEISPAYCGVILQRFFDHTGIQPQLIA